MLCFCDLAKPDFSLVLSTWACARGSPPHNNSNFLHNWQHSVNFGRAPRIYSVNTGNNLNLTVKLSQVWENFSLYWIRQGFILESKQLVQILAYFLLVFWLELVFFLNCYKLFLRYRPSEMEQESSSTHFKICVIMAENRHSQRADIDGAQNNSLIL